VPACSRNTVVGWLRQDLRRGQDQLLLLDEDKPLAWIGIRGGLRFPPST
jgi:hypothetical protein